jgi:hypothetical protein
MIKFNIDKILATMGIIFSIILILAVIFILKKESIYLLPGLLSLLSFSAWLVIRQSPSLSHNLSIKLITKNSKNKTLLLTTIFFILLTLSILSLYFRPNLYVRPFYYFILISLMSSIVFLEIIYNFENRFSKLILLQILIIAVNLVLSEQLLFPSLIGIDPAYHQFLTTNIFETGHILQGKNYSNIPFSQLIVAITSIFSGFYYKVAAIISIGFSEIFCIVIFFYLIGKFVYNENVGLITGLVLVITNSFIQFANWFTPNTLATLFVPIIIYLLLFKKDLENTLLILIFMIAINLTHPISSLWILIILSLFFIMAQIYSKRHMEYKNLVSFSVLAFFAIFMLAWWMYASGIFTNLVELVLWGFNIDYTNAVPVMPMNIPLIENIYQNLGLFISASISIIGLLYAIYTKKFFPVLLAFSGFFTLAIGFFSLLAGTEILNVRWIDFAQIILSLQIAVVLVIFYNLVKKERLKTILLTLFIGAFSFIMITSSIANMDNNLFSPHSVVRYAYTTPEIDAAYFFTDKSVGNISSDFDYAVNPSSSIFANDFNMNFARIYSLDNFLISGQINDTGNIIILRKEIFTNPFRLQSGLYQLKFDPETQLDNMDFNKIYDSGSVIAYK